MHDIAFKSASQMSTGTEPHAAQRVDLHVHSKHSGQFHLYVLRSMQVAESYAEPADIYRRLTERGMSLVTITDHDTIDGCLEIAHHGDHVFLSEEISARFPENGCIVHVLAYGVTEAQHADICRLRRNVYELVPYLRSQGIRHSLAHPFSPVNQRLRPDIIKKSLLLFDNLEVVNGQKDPGHARFVREVIQKVGRPVLERWANELDIPPAAWDRGWGATGGSDDHSGLEVARAWTEFEGDATAGSFLAALHDRRTRPVGLERTGKSYGHTAFITTVDYFRNTHPAGDEQTYSQVLRLLDRGGPGDGEVLPPAVARIAEAARQTAATMPAVPSREDIDRAGHTPELHDELYQFFSSMLLRAFQGSFRELQDSVFDLNPEKLIDELPNLLRLALFNIPYYFTYRYFYAERRRAWAVYDWLDLPDKPVRAKNVAIFADTIDNVDGVGRGLRRMCRELREDGRNVYLCAATTSADGHGQEEPWIVRFPCIGTFPLPAYGSYTLGWPSLLEIVRWLDENEIDLIQVSTPGPVGVVAMLASRVLGVPIIGQYHTNVADYAARLIGDRTIGRIVKGWTSWFYGALAEVIVPSRAAGRVVADHGIREDKIRVIPRGVDTRRFHPGYRDVKLFSAYGLAGRNTLLYVGRVSVEKNLPFLVEVFRSLVDEGVDVDLAVVGDGPYLEDMKRDLDGYPAAFTGYLDGEALSAAFASADLLVFPSTTDTFGNVVLEALASGTPAVVSDLGGPADIVRHRETGLVVAADDRGAWRAAILSLVDDARKRRSFGKAARAYAQQCTYERSRAALWSFYEEHIERLRRSLRDDLR